MCRLKKETWTTLITLTIHKISTVTPTSAQDLLLVYTQKFLTWQGSGAIKATGDYKHVKCHKACTNSLTHKSYQFKPPSLVIKVKL